MHIQTNVIHPLTLVSQVGLPAKSGVSGAILLVIPNVMGVMCWSPPLDRVGNSVRGIQFCEARPTVFLMCICVWTVWTVFSWQDRPYSASAWLFLVECVAREE